MQAQMATTAAATAAAKQVHHCSAGLLAAAAAASGPACDESTRSSLHSRSLLTTAFNSLSTLTPSSTSTLRHSTTSLSIEGGRSVLSIYCQLSVDHLTHSLTHYLAELTYYASIGFDNDLQPEGKSLFIY